MAHLSAALALVPDAPADQKQHEINELKVARSALIKDRTRLLNRLKTQVLALTRRQTKARIAQADRQLGQIDAEIERRLRGCPKRARNLDILLSIKGLGRISAMAILIECPEIGTLTRKQAASLAGLAPVTRQSGRWQGHAFIQGGRKALRDALYMPALVAARHNPDLRDKYKSMTKAGKPAKVALTALMRKLIELANALIQQDRKWTPKPT